MGTGYVYYRDGLDRATRDALLTGLTGLEFVIHHSAARIACEQWPTGPDDLLPHGRAFGPEIEVRWHPVGIHWEMQLLSETRLTIDPAWAETEMESDPPHRVALWGRHWSAQTGASSSEGQLDGWVQAEIPADLRYPVAGNAARPLVQAKAITYRLQGRPQLTRFLMLETMADPQAAH